ncbi:ABC-type polysaccharide/polyol phosphate transport system, ATPase component [Caballeronia arationis]|uniref:ABC-type polysaccharide/polyol phosphate transport system, ATPase component n=1 Tax=Caballeronia arationis TaxID=1777142 RepID=A0A7Z7I7P3_9BURK|nr:ABC transporter ATP-binding protein [Caballeronia arationis]SOE80813.1 ABC-type polysaccharide/polyol phosphate transport system, ATPase component [Caballeronia arationis]
MSSDVIIRVSDLGKGFRAYKHPSDRLKQSLYGLAARLTPVPTLKAKLSRRAIASAQVFWALRHVDLEVRRGETVGIIGRNGSGKSTLLQMVCGTLAPTEGSVTTQGRVAALLELGSGFDVEFTGRENVYMNGQLHGLSKEQIDERFDAIAAFADIGDFLEQPVKTYSSGMFVRLAFAVIAHVDADVLIIDEALAVGDAFFTQKCMRFLRKFMQTGTVLFVSHDSSAIRGLCTRAMWMDHGKVIDVGDAKDVCNRYLEAYYEEHQGKSRKVSGTKQPAEPVSASTRRDRRGKYDAQQDRAARNFVFDPESARSGSDAATIERVEMLKEDSSPLLWVVGRENVTLRITARVRDPLEQPVFGFTVKDKLGRMLFGDNTFWVPQDDPAECVTGDRMVAEFRFAMPILLPGDYAVDIALADAARPRDAQVLHWQHDAYLFKSDAATSSTGLIGMPMREISLEVVHLHTS